MAITEDIRSRYDYLMIGYFRHTDRPKDEDVYIVMNFPKTAEIRSTRIGRMKFSREGYTSIYRMLFVKYFYKNKNHTKYARLAFIKDIYDKERTLYG